MGNCLRKPSHRLKNQVLNESKLNELLEEVYTNASIDYLNQEILDIKAAVYIMLERIVTRVNEREMFKISRIQPCGSMAEQTAVWKYGKMTGARFTEFDFLAILCYPFEMTRRDHGCRGLCVRVRKLPMSIKPFEDRYDLISELKMTVDERVLCDRLFWRELHMSLGSACDCFSVEFDKPDPGYCVSYKSSSSCESEQQLLCSKCNVEMPTGILSVNRSVSIGRSTEANCSLVFSWTSTANTLFVCDKLLNGEPEQIDSLSIHVDFLPALEELKAKPHIFDARKNALFLVPKHCSVCDRREHWRKSNCIAEIAYICNDMSEKHRKCFKIIKYLLSRSIERHVDGDKTDPINWYYVKTVALNHSRECSDSSDGCAECVLNILNALKHAYETLRINAFHEPDVNIMCPYYRYSYTDACARIPRLLIERLCSVANADSCYTLLQTLPDRLTHSTFKLV